jgi:glycosyltransferase involved in cell wall biosynthesis
VKLGYIIGTYPLISTTFIDREIDGLRARGFQIVVLSLRRPPHAVTQVPAYRGIVQDTMYLLPIAWLELIAAHIFFALTHPLAYWGLLVYLVTRRHPSLRVRAKTFLHWAEGVCAAYRLRRAGCEHFHAHFADRAAIVALCASRLLGKPYSLTAHANDLYVSPQLLAEKFKHAQFAVTVSEFNKQYILQHCPGLDAQKIFVLHPWVDLREFVPPAERPANRRLTLVSVGRLVAKKGHCYLIQACRWLRDAGVHIDCHIIGAGPLENELCAQINAHGLADCVHLEGARTKTEILQRLSAADVFVLASVIAPDGDRDGMPVALAEAMAMQVPVIASDLVGIGEMVQPDAGILVPPADSRALAQAIQSIYTLDRDARGVMGKRGRAIIERDFDVNRGIDRLADLFRQSMRRSMFIVWGEPNVGPRSRLLARELGIESLHFIHAGSRRGIFSAPWRYAYQTIATMRALMREQPRVVFVQSPPSLAVWCVYLYCRATGAKYLIDAHSAAMLQKIWMTPRWLHRRVLRAAITTIVTNEHFAAQIQAEGGQAFILRDVPTQLPVDAAHALPGKFKVVIVNTFSDDEPLEAILAAARGLPEIDFYITGKKKHARPGIFSLAPVNVHFTDFLPDGAYYATLAGADAVMCLTTREHTMQRGACEALSLGKPIITSDTDVLRNYFYRGAVHTRNTCESIRDALLNLKADFECYQNEILELQNERRAEWRAQKHILLGLMQAS